MTNLVDIQAHNVVEYAAVKAMELEQDLIFRINNVIKNAIYEMAEQGVTDFIINNTAWENEQDKRIHSPLPKRVVSTLKSLFKQEGYKLSYKASVQYNAQFDMNLCEGYYIGIRPKRFFWKRSK